MLHSFIVVFNTSVDFTGDEDDDKLFVLKIVQTKSSSPKIIDKNSFLPAFLIASFFEPLTLEHCQIFSLEAFMLHKVYSLTVFYLLAFLLDRLLNIIAFSG